MRSGWLQGHTMLTHLSLREAHTAARFVQRMMHMVKMQDSMDNAGP